MVFATGVRFLCNHTSAIINAFNTIVLAICTSNHRYYEPSCMNTIRTAAYLDCCQLGAGLVRAKQLTLQWLQELRRVWPPWLEIKQEGI